MLKVGGADVKAIYSGKEQEGIYQPEGGTIQEMPGDEAEAVVAQAMSLQERMDLGKIVYGKTCMACHQPEGEGIPSAFPPLANSDYLNADIDRAISIVLYGKSGEITVNGEKYNSIMTKQVLSDQEVASVMTYVLNNWGNSKKEVTAMDVTRVRSEH